ncbi:hypothetical protein V2G26_021296 [Clonostachys chloroleuca]
MSSLNGGDSLGIEAYIAELAQSMLAKGGDDLPIDFLGDIQLHHAHVRRAEWGILSWIHGDAARGHQDQTRLWCNSSASKGSLNVARLLLDSGASVHSNTISGQTHFAEVVTKGSVRGVRFLLENGADANARAINGQTVIAHATKEDNVELVDLLLQHGANVNATDIVGNPILATAVESGNENNGKSHYVLQSTLDSTH